MIPNKIDLNKARKIEFLTHTLYIQQIGNFLSAYCDINDNVYLEMQLSSNHLASTGSLRDINVEAMGRFITSMFGIQPNPDFVFKGNPLENERYLIHRYIKSIFQKANSNLFLFSDDHQYRAFCEKNNLEWVEQEWFAKLYINDHFDRALDYLVQNSIIFQELYFPKDKINDYKRPSLHDVERLKKTYTFKPDFTDIYRILEQNNISALYHFTDRSNISSIQKYGLLSINQFDSYRIKPKYASSVLSRDSDRIMGLNDYIRLSFCARHPMMFTSMTAYGLNPVIIEINPIVALLPNVYFSDRNALKRGAQIGPSSDDLKKIRFDIATTKTPYYELKDTDSKLFYSAEILVKTRIGPEFFLKVVDYWG